MARPCECDNYVSGEPFVPGRDCHQCHLWHNDAAFRAKWEAKGPSLVKRARNFARAAVRHVATGMEQVSEEEFQARRATCEACEFMDKAQEICTHQDCGCSLRGKLLNKLRWASEKCPIGKWQAVEE